MRTHIFVSYCHRDIKWLNRLQIHLKPLSREGKIDLWDDTQLRPGTKWRETIHQALTRAKVAVLLISADFLASEFIVNNELPLLLAAAENEGAVIIPVVISPSLLEKTALAKYQTVNHPLKPLISMTKAKQEDIWLKVAMEIDKALTYFEPEQKQGLKIFIGYVHQDEIFKDESVVMLADLQRRGVIDTWQDWRIQAGEEWFKAVEQSINDSDMAVLLVSPNFLASPFINDEDLLYLLKRREREGMSVIPIIIRPCRWQSEPVLKDLQALPKDGKAVITFSQANGERDQVWTDIATVIEKRAKAKTKGVS